MRELSTLMNGAMVTLAVAPRKKAFSAQVVHRIAAVGMRHSFGHLRVAKRDRGSGERWSISRFARSFIGGPRRNEVAVNGLLCEANLNLEITVGDQHA